MVGNYGKAVFALLVVQGATRRYRERFTGWKDMCVESVVPNIAGTRAFPSYRIPLHCQ